MPGLLTLRDFKGPVITVECKPCGQQGELDRKALVKQFGASMRFGSAPSHGDGLRQDALF